VLLATPIAWMLAFSATAAGPVQAVTIEGESIDGAWAGINAEGKITLTKDNQSRKLAPAEIMLLRFPSQPASQPSAALPVTIFLSDGSRLPARIMGGDAHELEIQTTAVPLMKLPLSNLAAIRYATSRPTEAEDVFQKALSERDASQDVLLNLREGRITPLRGITESLTAHGGSFRWRERSIPIQAETTYGIVFAAGVRSSSEAPPIVCTMIDGSAWAGRIISGNDSNIELQLPHEMKVSLSVSQISEIQFRSDRVVFLSDLEPSKYEYTPFDVTQWSYRRNRSVSNGPLKIGDQVFPRGLGMHSQSKLVYELKDRFKQLAATIGIDAVARPRGNAIFRVLTDGKEAYNSGPVTGHDAARPILVPLNAAKQLQLIVEFGDELDIGDHADWGNARQIK